MHSTKILCMFSLLTYKYIHDITDFASWSSKPKVLAFWLFICQSLVYRHASYVFDFPDSSCTIHDGISLGSSFDMTLITQGLCTCPVSLVETFFSFLVCIHVPPQYLPDKFFRMQSKAISSKKPS